MNEVRITRDYVANALIVEAADPVIWVYDELWQEVLTGDLEPGVAGVPTIDGDKIMSFGTPGRSLGRVSYRWREFDPIRGLHILERIE